MKYILLLLSSLFFSESMFAQSLDTKKLDAYFDALDANSKFMGSVAVMKDGKMIYTKSIGYAEIDGKMKANEQTKYRIGSISKTFTAVLTLLAVEEGKLTLDQTIDKYFPGIPNASKITINHLLYHRSGIHNFTNDESYRTWLDQPKTEQQMVEIITNAGSDFEPDSVAAYSNSNFLLLSYILQHIYGQPYKTLVTGKITKALGLKNTYVGGPIDTKINEAQSYSYRNGWIKETETDLSIPLGAGAVSSTPSDLTSFISALFAGKILKSTSLSQMTTLKNHFGMGLFEVPFYDSRGFGHTGGIDGFSSVMAYFPDVKLAYALTSNGSNFTNNDISIAVLSSVYDKPYDVPVFKTYTISAETLHQYTGVYSSPQIPITITITEENGVLIGQGSGQPSFALEASDVHTFRFDQAGVILIFDPAANTMILKQGGGEFTFSRKKE